MKNLRLSASSWNTATIDAPFEPVPWIATSSGSGPLSYPLGRK